MLQKGYNDQHKNMQAIFFILQDVLCDIVKIFCIWPQKAEFIMSVFAQVSDVPNELLVF